MRADLDFFEIPTLMVQVVPTPVYPHPWDVHAGIDLKKFQKLKIPEF
jgi:hypothetical protein